MSPILRITGSDETASAWNSAQRAAQTGIGNIKNMLPGLAVALSAAGMLEFGRQAFESAEQLNKLSQRTGIAVEDLSALKFAADQADVPIEGLAQGIKKLSVSAVAAVDANSEMGRTWKALGVTATDSNGKLRPANELLLSMADRFSKMQDGAQKTALAVKVFGKTGDELIPFLNMGKDGITKLTMEAQRLGLVLSQDAAEAAERFNDNVKVLKATGQSLAFALVEETAPALGRISAAMRQALVDSGLLKAGLVAFGGVVAQVLNLDTPEAAEKVRDLRNELAMLNEKQREYNAELAKDPSDKKLQGWIKGVQSKIDAAQAALKVAQVQADNDRKNSERNKSDQAALEDYEKDRKAAQAFIDALKKEAETAGMAKDQLIAYNAAKLGAKMGPGSVQIAIALRNEAAHWAALIAAQEKAKNQVDYLAAAYAQFGKAQDSAIGAIETEISSMRISAAMWDKTNEERRTATLLSAMVDAGISKESDTYRDAEARLNAVNAALEHSNDLKTNKAARELGLKSLKDETAAIQFETATMRLNNDQRERAQLLRKLSGEGVNVLSNPLGAAAMDAFDAAQKAREDERRRVKIEDDKKALDQQTAQLIMSLRTDEEMEQAHFVVEHDLLDQSWAQKLITEEQYQAAKLRLQDKYGRKSVEQRFNEEKQKAGLTKIYGKATLNDAEFFANQMGALMQTKSRTLFEIGKAGAIAGATIDTYKAATGAYAALASIPIIGPALGAAAAMAAIAVGMARVSAIKSTAFGTANGGAIGTFAANPSTGLPESTTSSGFDPITPVAQQTQPARPAPRNVNLTIIGDTPTTKWLRDELIPALNDAMGDGGPVLTIKS